ncbi:hypothetical protein [Actinomyces bovis]|uniref:hypothetical protein n=1 Tax=Actinomyces bovis TaxID=1658 RepID=UPI000DCFCEE0|nr:hypothetical protein [Actinomyces bovis]
MKPLLLTSFGLLLTVVYLVVFLVTLNMATGPRPGTRTVLNSTPQSVKLTVDEWGIYSDDPNTSCTVTAADGSAISLKEATKRTYSKPEQFLSFEIVTEGEYQVACTASLPAELNLSALDDDYQRSYTMFQLLPPTMIIGLAFLVPGCVWLFRARRDRRLYRAARTAFLSHGGDPAAFIWSGGAAPAAMPPLGGVPAAQPFVAGYGELASAGPAASAPTATGLQLPNGSGGQLGWSQPGGGQAESAQSGPYGIAPKQVIYRAVPTQDDAP